MVPDGGKRSWKVLCLFYRISLAFWILIHFLQVMTDVSVSDFPVINLLWNKWLSEASKHSTTRENVKMISCFEEIFEWMVVTDGQVIICTLDRLLFTTHRTCSVLSAQCLRPG